MSIKIGAASNEGETKKVVLITGASSGIGYSTAHAFAQRGIQTVLADTQVLAGEELAKKITEIYDVPSIFVKCDISQNSEVKELIQKTMDRFGRLDFAFNNAGIEGVSTTIADCTEENWDRVLGINLKGTWLCMKYEIEAMLRAGGGSIVNCSSVAGLVGFPQSGPYCASKHGMVGLTKAAALEYAQKNIRINAVCPGVIATPMIQRFTQDRKEILDQLRQAEPMGRLGQPQEIAEAVFWLCSAQSSFVTGQSLAVDGGWIAQ